MTSQRELGLATLPSRPRRIGWPVNVLVRLLASCAIALTADSVLSAETSSRPNVLFFALDDWMVHAVRSISCADARPLPYRWRELNGGAANDSILLVLLASEDVISPWTVTGCAH